VTCVDWLMMWHNCMSREVFLLGHRNISIDDSPPKLVLQLDTYRFVLAIPQILLLVGL
jgi:hypothetical protein